MVGGIGCPDSDSAKSNILFVLLSLLTLWLCNDPLLRSEKHASKASVGSSVGFQPSSVHLAAVVFHKDRIYYTRSL